MNVSIVAKKFDLGSIVVTPGARNVLTHEDVIVALIRHVSADWGELGEYDWRQNDYALVEQGRLLSRYRLDDDLLVYVITEADRSVTTILLPEEY